MKNNDLSILSIFFVVLIACCSGLILGVVNKLTKGPIERALQNELEGGLNLVSPGFNERSLSSKIIQQKEGADIEIYPVFGSNGTFISGYAVKSTVYSGYSGEFGVVFGVQNDGTISSVRIQKSTETPGLGSKTSDQNFLKQFDGKSLENFNFRVKQDGGSVDAVTGATISSRAASLAIEKGLEGIKDFKSKVK